MQGRRVLSPHAWFPLAPPQQYIQDCCELQSPAGLTSPLPQVNFCSFREFFVFFIVEEQNHSSGLPGVLCLVFPLAICYYKLLEPYFVHKYPWLKQSSSVLQKEMCQTNLCKKPKRTNTHCDKMLAKSSLSISYSSPELEKKVCARI